jgi:hypothetical protein
VPPIRSIDVPVVPVISEPRFAELATMKGAPRWPGWITAAAAVTIAVELLLR